MRVALISDIHANIYALEAVFSDIRKESIDRILVAGDLIGYYYWPKEVLQLLRSDSRVTAIRGNHEVILSHFISGAASVDGYRKKYGSAYDVCLNELNLEERQWLMNLPEKLELDVFGYSFYLGHGSLNTVDEYIYPDSCLKKLNENCSTLDFTVFGHTHYPFFHVNGKKTLVNPGSVGQPRDKGGLASYVILNLENCVTQFKRCTFDTAKVMKSAQARDPELEYLWKIMHR